MGQILASSTTQYHHVVINILDISMGYWTNPGTYYGKILVFNMGKS